MNIVGIGGGTGLPVLLRGLRHVSEARSSPLKVTAIVTASDNGGSSGVLRRVFGIPAVGDIRNCLLALSGADSPLAAVCGHRFRSAAELDGHAVGNLIIAALYQMCGDFTAAVAQARDLLGAGGIVLPSTVESTTLRAEYHDGLRATGEADIPRSGARIRRVWVEPHSPEPAPGVLDAIGAADAIVLGPGSLYTSIIPNLLVRGVADAIRRSRAVRVYVCNLMTEPGETEGYSAGDHLRALQAYLPLHTVDTCIVSTGQPGTTLAERYSKSGSQIVAASEDELTGLGVQVVAAPLIDSGEARVRHNPEALAQAIVSLLRESQPAGQAETQRLSA